MTVITVIGSRETPKDKLEQLTSLSKQFSDSNWVLRSGGAPVQILLVSLVLGTI